MRHRFALGGTIVASVALLLGWILLSPSPLSAMEQTAEAVRKVKSFQFDSERVYSGPPGSEIRKMWRSGQRSSEIRRMWLSSQSSSKRYRIYWSAGHVRGERLDGDKIISVTIYYPDESELAIQNQRKTYVRTKVPKGAFSPLDFVTSLMKVSGEADEDLGSKQIGQIEARGFRISAEKLDPTGSGGHTAAVWVDPKSKLPILVEIKIGSSHVQRIENFRWDVTLSPELFNPQLPADYIDVTPAPADSNEQVAEIVTALRTYAEVADGRYPTRIDSSLSNVKSQLRAQLGFPMNSWSPEQEGYARYCKAVLGFDTIGKIQRENLHFGYFGQSVGLKDVAKVLMHWERDVGNYRVIYGDLKSETVTEFQLRELLQQN